MEIDLLKQREAAANHGDHAGVNGNLLNSSITQAATSLQLEKDIISLESSLKLQKEENTKLTQELKSSENEKELIVKGAEEALERANKNFFQAKQEYEQKLQEDVFREKSILSKEKEDFQKEKELLKQEFQGVDSLKQHLHLQEFELKKKILEEEDAAGNLKPKFNKMTEDVKRTLDDNASLQRDLTKQMEVVNEYAKEAHRISEQLKQVDNERIVSKREVKLLKLGMF